MSALSFVCDGFFPLMAHATCQASGQIQRLWHCSGIPAQLHVHGTLLVIFSLPCVQLIKVRVPQSRVGEQACTTSQHRTIGAIFGGSLFPGTCSDERLRIPPKLFTYVCCTIATGKAHFSDSCSSLILSNALVVWLAIVCS